MITLAPESWPAPLLNAVRASNRHLLNPLMLRLAGHTHWYAAAIRHTGRRSGKQYATPVVAERVPDGFVIPLPYGTRVDWLQKRPRRGACGDFVRGRKLRRDAARDHRRGDGPAPAVGATATHLPTGRHRTVSQGQDRPLSHVLNSA
nr:hypothetical protein [Mycobacterium sp. 663a-19]